MGAARRGGKGESRAVSTMSAAPRWGIGCRWLGLSALTLLVGCGKQQPVGLQRSAPVASGAQGAVASSPPAAAPSPAAKPVARVEDLTEKYAGQLLHPNLLPGEQPCTGETSACPAFSNARVLGGFQVTRGEIVEENLVLVDVDTMVGYGCNHGTSFAIRRTVRDPSGSKTEMHEDSFTGGDSTCGGPRGLPTFDLMQLGPEQWGWKHSQFGNMDTRADYIICFIGSKFNTFAFEGRAATVYCFHTESEDADCRWPEMNATATFEPGTNPDFYDIVIDERTEYFGAKRGQVTQETRRYRMAEGGYQILAGPYPEPPKPTGPER